MWRPKKLISSPTCFLVPVCKKVLHVQKSSSPSCRIRSASSLPKVFTHSWYMRSFACWYSSAAESPASSSSMCVWGVIQPRGEVVHHCLDGDEVPFVHRGYLHAEFLLGSHYQLQLVHRVAARLPILVFVFKKWKLDVVLYKFQGSVQMLANQLAYCLCQFFFVHMLLEIRRKDMYYFLYCKGFFLFLRFGNFLALASFCLGITAQTSHNKIAN